MELLECIDINKSYGDKKVLKNVNLKMSKGKIIGLLGKNGMGKTTIIKLMNDLLTVTNGEVLINGYDIFEDPVEAKKCIGYLPETPPLYMDMTAGRREQDSEKKYTCRSLVTCIVHPRLSGPLPLLTPPPLQTRANASLKTENRPIRSKCMETYS